VVFAVKDPNIVAAGGADALRAAGIKVVDGVLAREASYANRAWLSKITKKRPFFVWKVATTLDAKIAASDGTSKWISNEVSRSDVQRLRRESDAILVGTNTVIVDNPHLIPRGEFSGFSSNPIRIIFGVGNVPADSKVFDSAAETVQIKSRDLSELVSKLNELNVNQVFVEAGTTLASAMIAGGLLDELVIYQAPALLGSGKPFYSDDSKSTIEDQMRLEHISTEVLAGDVKSVYRIGAGV
jgi:diaminohydroxyphosphoribosylaminopyrimidine deaminase/5-amino-6-(5-phosphoribosylamino)uracil reductase